MYSLPSASQSCRRPAPRVKKRGVPPTERKARTGELTPPGMVRWARAKRTRHTDDRMRAQPLPGSGRVAVITPDMHAVCIDRQRQLHIVVDDETGTADGRDGAQRVGVGASDCCIGRLVAVLQQPGAAGTGRFGRAEECCAGQTIGRDGIQAAQ
jgi:hypothetical protein